MDHATLPNDYFTTSMQFTKTLHSDVYPAIDPKSPALSQAGKVIIITGASRGLGRRGLAASFASASPKAIVLVARDAKQLLETAEEVRAIDPNIEVLVKSADVTDEASVGAVFNTVKHLFGTADVLVNNAGVASGMGFIGDVDAKAWWNVMEVNVKGTFLMTRAFLALIGRDKPASVINITGGIITVVMPAASAYTLSKLALTHLQQFVAAEYPRVTAVAVHPGVVKTDMTLPQFERFAVDPPALVGGFAVWAATDAARFLNGRFVDAHWSVDELVARRDEIAGQGQLLTGLKAKLGRDNL